MLYLCASVDSENQSFQGFVLETGLREMIMPKGPQGQKRPADTIGAAVMVAKIATGEIEDNKKSGRVRSGKAGAKARAKNLTSKQRSEIAKAAAAKRWA